MSQIIEHLRSLDRKERFAVLREALGFDREAPCLDDEFRTNLSSSICVDVPKQVFLAMDYHLDWIQLALHLDANPGTVPGCPFPKPEFGDINRDQEDVDLLVAFEASNQSRQITNLVLIEAKAYLPWTNRQLESKAKRLGEIFGSDIAPRDSVQPHFVLMTGRVSDNISTTCWPDWAKNGEDPYWLKYDLPYRLRAMRCSEDGKPSRNGTHLILSSTT